MYEIPTTISYAFSRRAKIVVIPHGVWRFPMLWTKGDDQR